VLAAAWLTRPIRKLTAAAARVGTGATDVRVKVRGRDEFAKLGAAFNEMVSGIGEGRDALLAQSAENERLLCAILPEPIAEAAGILAGPVAAPTTSFAGPRMASLVRIASDLRVGPLVVRNPVAQIIVADVMISGTDREPVPGPAMAILGSGLLRHFRVVIDQAGGRIALRDGPKDPLRPPGPRIVWIPWRTRSVDGASVVTDEPNPVPASGYRQPDIRPGDRLLALDGVPLKALTARDYRRRLEDRMSVEVTLERDGRRKKVVVPVIGLLP
jgi:HAMP domain-containing protein